MKYYNVQPRGYQEVERGGLLNNLESIMSVKKKKKQTKNNANACICTNVEKNEDFSVICAYLECTI